MLTRNLVFGVLTPLLLSGCAKTPYEEYAFIPTFDFPKLIDVPERPTVPSKSELDATKKELIEVRDAAIKKQAELWPLLPPKPADEKSDVVSP